MKTLTNKDKINTLKPPCYNLKIHDWNAAWCQLCTHHSPKCLRFHPLHEATMILSKFQAFSLKSHLMIVAHAPGIHTVVKEWVCIDWDRCWTTYSSKAKLCPQLDLRLEQEKIHSTSAEIMAAFQWILRKPFSLWPLFNDNWNKPLVITGIEWGSASCQDIYEHTLIWAQWKVYEASKNHYLYKLSKGKFHHMYDKP